MVEEIRRPLDQKNTDRRILSVLDSPIGRFSMVRVIALLHTVQVQKREHTLAQIMGRSDTDSQLDWIRNSPVLRVHGIFVSDMGYVSHNTCCDILNRIGGSHVPQVLQINP